MRKKNIFCILKITEDFRTDPHANPDPLVSGTVPRIRIRTKMSWIRNTDLSEGCLREEQNYVTCARFTVHVILSWESITAYKKHKYKKTGISRLVSSY
jgi:hypothetical protein